MRPKFRTLFLCLFVMASVLGLSVFAKDDPNAKRLEKSQGTLQDPGDYMVLNINNWVLYLEANGRSGYDPFHSGDGGLYPKGTSWVIFQDGFIFGGKLIDSRTGLPPSAEAIRIGGQTYNTGTVAGAAPGGVPENPNDPSVRIYRIRRDYNDPAADLRSDAAFLYGVNINAVTDADINALKALYDADWRQWPVAKGAPFIDRNGNGAYDPPPPGTSAADLIANNLDEPGIAGADLNSPAHQVMWTVCNDFNEANSRGLYGAAPIGVELQITAWGYQRSDALGSVLFRKYRLINRGFFRSDSFYVSQWSDPDLGDSGDDFAGCDTTIVAGKPVSLGYIYNSNSVDNEYRKYSLPPPAGGYDFFQGPLIPGEPTDEGIFDLKKRTGFTNLAMTTFNFFSAGSAVTDPPLTQYEGSLRWWKMLRGFVADPSTRADRQWLDDQGAATAFPLAGDPVAKTGWYDGVPPALPPGDRRILLVSGPFKFEVADTQEVVVGIVAGLGADRLSSISVMKFNDRFAQNTYDALFAVPQPPPQPITTVRNLNQEVSFDWGSDLAAVQSIETVVRNGYHFEGYNVYQLPNANAGLDDEQARKIATFDVINELTVILDDQFDPESGQILRLPVQQGGNSGIQRFFKTSADAIAGSPRLRNGQEYYFAVTAYAVAEDPAATPLTLESPPRALVAVPQSPPPGVRYEKPVGEAVNVEHSAGVSGGSVEATVVDPAKTTGANYTVTFRNNAEGVLEWVLNRNNQEIFSSTNQGPIVSGDPNDEFNYPTIDGLYITVAGALEGMKGGNSGDAADPETGWAIPAGTRRWTWAQASGSGWGFEGFNGAIGWDDPAHYFGSTETRAVKGNELTEVLIKLAPTDANGVFDPNHPNVSYGYRYLRGNANAPAKPEFAPFIINTSGGYAYQDFTKSVPFAAYNMDVDPPQRLAVAYHENNTVDGLVDGKYWPGDFNTTNNNNTREFGFILLAPYSETPDPALQINILTTPLPVMYWMTFNRRGNVAYTEGDEFAIYPHRPNTPTDVFAFAAPAQAAFNASTAAADVAKVNVFPNPYYAFNAAEVNRFARYVTFNFLPQQAKVRIYNLAGQLVRVLDKNDDSQFLRWDLANQSNFPVASGVYIAHIDMPALGQTKILKIAVIIEQEVLDVF